MNALFWWQPGTSAAQAAQLDAAEVAASCGVSTAQFLGRGGFGETWRITHADGSVEAVKVVLNPQYPPKLLAREVAGLQRVTDPRVVSLHDVRRISIGGVERAALFFEFVDGGDVASRLAASTSPTTDEARIFLRELTGGVAALHATNTIHRDIKPENIALRGSSWASPVLLDLGLAKQLDVESMTQYPAQMGTFAFMAPEQVRMEPARKSADVWAIGVLAQILLSGRHPYLDGPGAGIDSAEVLDRMESAIRPLPVSVPAPLAAITLRLLTFDPADRGSVVRAHRELEDLA